METNVTTPMKLRIATKDPGQDPDQGTGITVKMSQTADTAERNKEMMITTTTI